MKKAYSLILGLFVFMCALVLLMSNALAYNNNNVMDDGIFDNSSSMSASDIDTWLNNNFGSTSCISTAHGFAAPDVTGYSASSGLFSFGGDVSAGTVIAHTAHVYGLNPRVILSTLQKEESLVSGASGCSTLRYSAAMGYNCPDNTVLSDYSGFELYSINGSPITSVSGTCVQTQSGHQPMVGFSRQVIVASWSLKFSEQRSEGNTSWDVQLTNYPNSGNVWDNSDDPSTCYSGPMTQGFRAVCSGGPTNFYDGSWTIDSTAIHIDTGATAALYRYTPHFSGNQSFDNIFQSWFGSVFDIYSWSVLSQNTYTDSSHTAWADSSSLAPGQKVYAIVTARNTGDTTWSNSTNPVRLATTSPQDRTSSFCDMSDSPTWVSCNRAATMDEASVAPGGTATFEFWYKAPNAGGTFNEHFSLVTDGLSWMNDPGLYFHTVVQSIYTWSIVSQASFTDASKSVWADSSALTLGNKVYLVVKAKNTGNITWLNSGANPTRLGVSNPQDRTSSFCDMSDSPTWVSCNRAATMDEASVAPGGTATFEFWYKPSQTGTFREYFTPVVDGITWMNNLGLNYFTTVNFDTSGTSTTLGTNQSLNSGQFLVSTDGRFKLIMQSDGNLVLYSINRPLWSSRTDGRPVTRASMQSDGNLVLYDAQNRPYWASNTAGKGISTLVIQTDGNLVIYDSGNHPTWASNTNGQL